LTELDRSLVRACQEGDRRAWETLVHRYERLLYAIPLRCGLSEDDAADVFQTVCIKLLENLGKLRDERHLTGWLITTARHESWRVYRQKSRYMGLEEEGAGDAGDASSAPPGASLLPQEAVLRLEEEQMVRRAVQELGDRCRTLLEWLYQTDPTPSYAEIAKRLNVPIGAIGPTRARCLQQLKKTLQKMDF